MAASTRHHGNLLRSDSASDEELAGLRSQLIELGSFEGDWDTRWHFTSSAPMLAVKEIIGKVAATDVTVLTWGESGVGKEMVSQTLHLASPRRDHPFVKVNCAALPLELLESELFGYERGAFTGAHRQKPGKFELANRGTIFLDEVGELPWPLQAKLLHVLQDRQFSRLGSERSVSVDVRVVAATNTDLAKMVAQQRFREDLYYRLNVVSIRVPPLRERLEEIPGLVEYFLQRFSAQYSRPRPNISPETTKRFMEYTWPGNIRELENVVKRIVVLRSESWVTAELPLPVAASASLRDASPPSQAAPAGSPEEAEAVAHTLGLKEIGRRAAAAAERTALKRALEELRWNRTDAARRLKVNYKTLLQKIEQYGLGRDPRQRP